MSDGTFLPRGVTPWSAYNTPRIWAMVENEDDPESWRQVAALGSMAGLLNDQRKRLELARDALIQAWPPEQNAASKAFVELIDDLLFNMKRNKEIADSNAGALGQIVETLRQAKGDIDPLYKAYVEKSDDWVPAWWDSAEDELDEKARERMREAERIIAHPDNAITVPPVYELKPDFTRTKIDNNDDALTSGQGGGRFGPGVVGSGGAGGDFAVPHEPPPPLPGREPSSVGGTNPSGPAGPELAGVVTPSNLPGTPLPATLPPSGTSAVAAGPGLVIGEAILGPSSPLRAGGSSAGGRRIGGSPGLPSGSGVRSVVSAPAGSGAKPATPAWLPQASGPPARGGSNPSRRGSGVTAMPMTSVRRPQDERGGDRTFDPDNLWVTAEGVDPVIEPSRRIYRHDPGPGVIGRLR